MTRHFARMGILYNATVCKMTVFESPIVDCRLKVAPGRLPVIWTGPGDFFSKSFEGAPQVAAGENPLYGLE